MRPGPWASATGVTTFLDAELKVLAGRITPDLSAAAVQFGITYRFKPSL